MSSKSTASSASRASSYRVRTASNTARNARSRTPFGPVAARFSSSSFETPLFLTCLRKIPTQPRQPRCRQRAQPVEQLLARHNLQLHAPRQERVSQFLVKHASSVLMAVGFDQVRPMSHVNATLPPDPVTVAGPVWRRAPVFVQREVFDVDVVVRKIEIRLVLSMLRGGGRLLVRSFVLEINSVHAQEIGDLHFFEALDLDARKCSKVAAPKICLIFTQVLEIEWRFQRVSK